MTLTHTTASVLTGLAAGQVEGGELHRDRDAERGRGDPGRDERAGARDHDECVPDRDDDQREREAEEVPRVGRRRHRRR